MPRLMPARMLAALQPDATSGLGLPDDVVRESRQRVRIAAAIGSFTFAVFLLSEQVRLAGTSPLERSIALWHDAIGLGLCAALWLATLAPKFTDRSVLAIALGVQVLLSAAISFAVPWSSYLRTQHVPGLTWVVPIVILFPLLVPARPISTFAVSVVCAVTVPAGLWRLESIGAIAAGPQDYWAGSVTGGVAVAIAAVASRAVYGAGRLVAAVRMAGSYELGDRIGRGGMGEVWKARHILLARPAAVKRILPDRLKGPREKREQVMERFWSEARVTANLRSPHTVAVYDFGLSSEGAFYYAMELLDGMNFEHFVYQFGPLEPRRTVHWLQQACHSLAEAHGRGLVHRDIKPANLFVCRYGGEADFVKVLDFGLTRRVDIGESIGTSDSIQPSGTAGFMAPEQASGIALGTRTDLYALGCVGYWLLSGRKPFESDDSSELTRQHAEAEPPPLSSIATNAIPAGLEAVIRACLSKRPEDRPSTAEQLHAELEGSVPGAPWTSAEAGAWWDLHMK